MNPRHHHPHIDDHNMFLTATSSRHHPMTPKISHHQSPSRHHPQLPQNNPDSQHNIKQSILTLIKHFKSLNNSPQISHLFNEILYGLDGCYGEKKNIQRIAELLENQRNIIKLNRVWNRLKALKKQFDRLGLDKLQKTQFRFNSTQKNAYSKIKSSQPISTSNTFHKTTCPQINQLKENLISQISYRERLSKIQSQRQKHEQNRQKFIQKKLTKAKQMNKKVKEVYEKKKNMQKEQYRNHKYEMLYDPEDQRSKKRGKTMNFKRKQQQIAENETTTANIRSNQRSVTMKLQNQDGQNKVQSRVKKNLKFSQKEDEKYTKQDLKTFKSIKEMTNKNIKGSKSFKIFTKNQFYDSKQNQNDSRPRQMYTKIQDTSLNRSQSLGKNDDFAGQKGKFPHQQKLHTAISKRIQIEEERLKKIITQAVQKQKKIQQIYQRRALNKIKKGSDQSQQQLTIMNSIQSSPSKSYMKKVYTRKQLMDKQRRIFEQIQNKLQRKQSYLQQRVDRVRQRLRKQQMTKQRHKQSWQQYIQYSPTNNNNNNSSIGDSRRGSKENTQKQKQNENRRQQKVVKRSHFERIKKMEWMGDRERLTGLSMDQLKRRLREIDKQEEEKRRVKERVVF